MTQYNLDGFTATTGDTEIIVDSIITINYFVSPTTISFPEGLQSFWQLIYVDNGEATFSEDGKVTTLSRGQLWLRAPSAHRKTEITTSLSSNLVSISFTSDSTALQSFSDRCFNLIEKERKLLSYTIREAEIAFDSKLEDPFTRGLKPVSAMPPGAWQILKSSLELLLVNLYRSSTWKNTTEQRKCISVKERTEYLRMAAIINFLEESVHSKLTLDDICRSAGMSRSALQKLFKQRTGESVIGYFITLKINEAKRLLTDGRYSISAISDMLGYNSIHYFSRQFKQETGVSPSEYTRNPGFVGAEAD